MREADNFPGQDPECPIGTRRRDYDNYDPPAREQVTPKRTERIAHRCQPTQDAVYFAIAHAVCKDGHTLDVLSQLSPEEFHKYALTVDETCRRDGDLIRGRLMGFDWRVRIV